VDLPVVDVEALVTGAGSRAACAEHIGAACRDVGFFYVVGHGVEPALVARLERLSRRFFKQDRETKMELAMRRAGAAWRGYFPVGGELTAGRPDGKEGLYFGIESGDDDPAVRAGVPLHGTNLFPANIPEFRATVLDYTAALTRVGGVLMEDGDAVLRFHIGWESS
jgi:isopenicillin N synthase-like dioxygenase